MIKVTIEGEGLKYGTAISAHIADEIIKMITEKRQSDRWRREQQAGKCRNDVNVATDR